MTADGAVVAGHLAVAMCPTVLHAVVVKNTTWKDSVMTVAAPGWEFFWTELYHEMALLERERRAADAAFREHGAEGRDETSESLRKDIRATFNELVTNAPKYSQDPSRTRGIILRTAAITALDRLLTRPAGFSLEIVPDGVPHLLIHSAADADSPEGFDLHLVDVTGLEAMPGHVSVADCPPGDESRPDAVTSTRFPEIHFDHARHLLIAQVENASPRPSLAQHAQRLLDAVLNDPDSHGADPFRTKARLLRLVALIAADALLSRTEGIRHEPGRDRFTKVYVAPERHPPLSVELRLPPVPEPR